jgi:hypothetical protein
VRYKRLIDLLNSELAQGAFEADDGRGAPFE